MPITYKQVHSSHNQHWIVLSVAFPARQECFQLNNVRAPHETFSEEKTEKPIVEKNSRRSYFDYTTRPRIS